MNRRSSIICLSVFVVLYVFISVYVVRQRIGADWHGVPPSIVDDDTYYYARMVDIAEGHPFIGNPYFIEYRDSLSPAFFIPDWISAVPFLLNSGLIPAIVFDFILWGIIGAIISYLIAREFTLPPPAAAITSAIAFIEVYWLVMRPVAMQVVFPFFLFFLFSLLIWLKNRDNRPKAVLLAVSVAGTFYVYTYLWQIACIVLGLIFLHFAARRDWISARRLAVLFCAAVVLSLPVLAYTVLQIQSPFYWETFLRIGLTESHLPTIYAYQYGRWVLVFLGAFVLLRSKGESDRPDDPLSLAVIYSGIGLFVMAVSNILTGKELEIAQHTGRFITLWVALFLPVYLWRWWKERESIRTMVRWRVFVGMALIILMFGFLISNVKRSVPVAAMTRSDIADSQSYAAPLQWIDTQQSIPVVIWADEEMSTYIPILTRDYVLWDHLGALHLMPTKEVEDRFLLSAIGTSTRQDLIDQYRQYEGAGAVYAYSAEYNKNRLRCMFGLSCHTDKNLEEWIGTSTIDLLLGREVVLKDNLPAELKKYSVSYAIADKSLGQNLYFGTIYGLKVVWSDDRYIVYKLDI